MESALQRIKNELTHAMKDLSTNEKQEVLELVQEIVAQDKIEADFLNTIGNHLRQLGDTHFSKLWQKFMKYEAAAYSDEEIPSKTKNKSSEKEWEEFIEMRVTLLQEFKKAGGNEEQHLAVLQDAEKRSPVRSPFHSIIFQ